LILLRRRRTRVSGFQYFSISDTRSMRGKGIFASGFGLTVGEAISTFWHIGFGGSRRQRLSTT